MKCPFVIKVCTKCKELLVANNINFHKDKSKLYGVRNDCKKCSSKSDKEKKEKNKKELLKKYCFDDVDVDKVWNHCPFVIKVCSKCGKILVANKTNFRSDKGGKWNLKSRCRQCGKEYDKERRKDEDRKKYLQEYNKQYRESNKEYLKKWKEQYRKEKKEEIKEYNKQYYKQWKEDNPEKIFNNAQKRRHKIENQGRGISKEQWLEMMEFFDWKCAYSGIQLNKDNRSIDHIISLNKNGLNEPWNCVPMYKNYNTSKHINDMIAWYKKQDFFDISRLMKIYEWQEYAFEKWGK